MATAGERLPCLKAWQLNVLHPANVSAIIHSDFCHKKTKI
jgi:hypothetical protein